MAGKRHVLAAIITLALAGLLATQALAARRETDPTMNKRTRAYVSLAQVCVLAVGILQLDIKRGKSSIIQVTDETTQAITSSRAPRQ